jgi:tRNA pseudouridine38-40 synthase
MRNIRLTIAYDGTDFHGWQRQPDVPTVQSCLEAALERIIGNRVQVWGSGRTDAGVHALNQVANFKTDGRIPCENLLEALNNALPPTVRVKEAGEVAEKFHARYDARSKTYRYRVYQGAICSPFIWRFVWHYPVPLDRPRMAEAARVIEGEHDFTSFAGSEGREDLDGPSAGVGQHQGASPEARDEGRGKMARTVFSSRLLWRQRTSMLIYEVRGSGFLQHMVRNIVGTLVEVGKGKLAPGDMARILAARDRRLAGPTAPARGLCLVRVEY